MSRNMRQHFTALGLQPCKRITSVPVGYLVLCVVGHRLLYNNSQPDSSSSFWQPAVIMIRMSLEAGEVIATCDRGFLCSNMSGLTTA